MMPPTESAETSTNDATKVSKYIEVEEPWNPLDAIAIVGAKF